MDRVTAGYGGSTVVDDISLSVRAGESLAILGRNGVGKSTLLCTALGFTHLKSGQIRWRGTSLARVPAYRRVRNGLAWVPQERRVFRSLTVEEHLTAVARPGYWTLKRIREVFPHLDRKIENLGDQLSGGEQQMLAIARALMLNPSMLLLDEPLEGLAPIVAQDIARIIAGLIAQSGLAVILVEQHATQALKLTSSAVILERGRIVHRDTSDKLLRNEAVLTRWLSAGAAVH
jgi:branched-chain amino acid transport system ATP-binding protein